MTPLAKRISELGANFIIFEHVEQAIQRFNKCILSLYCIFMTDILDMVYSPLT